ncbi:hypothetical protein A2U01_0090178, partial [Trifolium medium]|nr:hypothetical protein [Trifolium medium]
MGGTLAAAAINNAEKLTTI